jgi:hypothetical protein
MTLPIWTIYDHPSDYPDYFVARKWLAGKEGERATSELLFDADLDTLRRRLPIGLYCMPRNEKDDPVIIECWV